MKKTETISARMRNIEREIKYISDEIINDPEFANKKLVFANGNEHPEWTNDDYLTVLIAQKSILEWVLLND